MSRCYGQLECGCLISCDGGGGLIPSCSYRDTKCKVDEYMKEHNIKYGWCPICHPIAYKQAIEEMGDYEED